MNQLLHDIMIWLAGFFGISLLLVCVLRFSLRSRRKQRAERLKSIEARCKQQPEDLGLPSAWRETPAECEAADYQSIYRLHWTVPLGLIAAGLMWSATGINGWNWNGAIAGWGAACLFYCGLACWLYWRRQTAVPPESRQLAVALRSWAIRLSAGMPCRPALQQAATQLRAKNPELAKVLEAGAIETTSPQELQHIFTPCGTGLAEQLAKVAAGKVEEPHRVLVDLAEKLDDFYRHRCLSCTRRIESWLKYPLGLCLVPALNLILFGPAIADLFDKFGTIRVPLAPQTQPLEPLQPIPEPDPLPKSPE